MDTDDDEGPRTMAAKDTEEKATPGGKNRRTGSRSVERSDPPPREAAKAGSGNRRVDPSGADATPPPRGNFATVVGALVGVVVGAGAIGAASHVGGCTERLSSRGVPSAAVTGTAAPSSTTTEAPPAAVASAEIPTAPDDANEPEVAEPDAATKEPEVKAWTGPWLGALAQTTPVYPTARFSKNRLGYLRRGAKVAVLDKPVHTDSCKQGFYPLVDGGYVCAKYATLDVEDSRVKMGVKAPDAEGLLPYRYAYNTAHGTPLYAQVPTREEMLKYEPYLKDRDKKKKAKEDAEKGAKADKADKGSEKNGEKSAEKGGDKVIERADQPHPDTPEPANSTQPATSSAAAARPSPSASGPIEVSPPPASSATAEDEDDDKPWWQRDSKGKALDIKLSDLEERDGTIARRMVKGFFVAVDRTFSWGGRLWYKTTEGLVAPADRMVTPKTPELKGFEIPDGVKQVAFVRAGGASKYERKKGGKGFSRKGKLNRFAAFALTGQSDLDGKTRYFETTDGSWLREADCAIAEPSARPDRVGPDEKWVDVNISRKTLVAMIGDKPVFAALVSPGKSSTVKGKDHRTKTGIFRIREKHVATTMDGDGTSGGDLPYSIMDVPYVEYYDGSYALHAAFWHNNFGREQSHGCVNLAPADAKWMFNWTEPALPKGWHGVWASEKRKGSWVVIHE